MIIDAVALRVLFPAAALGAALFAAHHHVGILTLLDLPGWLSAGIAIVALDLAIYGQHVATHHVGFLWRLHRVHHSDLVVGVTTALRFHPAEIVLSMIFKLGVVVALGAPAAAVVLFEVLLNGLAMFNHANIRLPDDWERLLRRVIVTPDMHRVHHSAWCEETNSNYGFCLSLWDRLFGTYRDQPRDGHSGMMVGLTVFRDHRAQRLDRLLLQPLLDR